MKVMNFAMTVGSIAVLAACGGGGGGGGDGVNVVENVNVPQVETFAGSGLGGDFNGDGSAATSARLSTPVGINFDAAGNLYIADVMNSRIRKVDRSGVITTIAGNGRSSYAGDDGQALSASIRNTRNVVVDKTGNIYISSVDGEVRKIEPGGIISTFTPFSSYSGAKGEMVVDSKNNLYIRTYIDCKILKFDVASKGVTTFAGSVCGTEAGDGGLAVNAVFGKGEAMTIDKNDNIYVVSEEPNGGVRKIDASGGVATVVDGSTVGGTIGGVAVDQFGRIFVSTFSPASANRIVMFDGGNRSVIVNQSGLGGFNGEISPPLSMRLASPRSMVVGPDENLYISDVGNNRIRRMPLPTMVN